MHPEDKIERLIHVGYYRAPHGHFPSPVPIRESCEYIEMITAGQVLFDDGSGERVCGAGTIFWHLPGESTIWKSVISDPYECLTVMFSLAPPFRRIAPRMAFWKPHEAKSFADEVLRAFHDESIDRLALSCYIHSRLLWAAYSESKVRKDAENLPQALLRALEKIESSFSEPLEISLLAEEARVSVPYLHTLFKKHLGSAPHQALLERRLQEAKKLLASSDMNLKSLAFCCGFPSTEHFCRVFKRRFGTTAASFRREHSPVVVLGLRPK